MASLPSAYCCGVVGEEPGLVPEPKPDPDPVLPSPELEPGFPNVELPKGELPSGLVVPLAGWPMAPVFPPDMFCMSEIGS